MKDREFQLTDMVRQTAYEVHRFFGPGHLEKVYENALAHRLRKQGLNLKQQHPITVRDEDGTVVGEYFADLFVEDALILELKAAREIANEHVAQLLGYLRASRIAHGALLNFGAQKFQIRKLGMRNSNPSRAAGITSLFTLISPFFPSFGQ
jgi:GxxExxY protein